eukprot:scaffold33076_cov51-Phaeocystis_antarctica.AAC.3
MPACYLVIAPSPGGRARCALEAPSWRRPGGRLVPGGGAAISLPVSACLRAVRYVGLTTTVFASRSAYKYAKEKRADATRAD